jgi:hypothetical protein
MRAIWMRLAVLVTVLSLAAGCTQLPQGAQPTQSLITIQPTPAPQPTATARKSSQVLFIGDSSSQGLDGLFPRLAASGSPPVTVKNTLMWRGGFSLEQQWEFTKAPNAIRDGKWDTVVLQDDLNIDWPGRAAEFDDYGRKFDQAIKQAGAGTVFYMIYPYRDSKETTNEEIAAAYGKIGQDLGDKVAPVALAFRRSLRERPDLKLHAEDGEHYSWAGFYLLGCVLYATIFERSPVGLTYRGSGAAPDDWEALMRMIMHEDCTLSEEDAAYLQRIAWETVQEYQAGR